MPKRKLALVSQIETENSHTVEIVRGQNVYLANSMNIDTNMVHSAPKSVKTVNESESEIGQGGEYNSEKVSSENKLPECSITNTIDEGEIQKNLYIISEITSDISEHDNDDGEDIENAEIEIVTTMPTEFVESVIQIEGEADDESEMQMQLMDFGGCCANCNIPFDDTECPKIAELILSENQLTEDPGTADLENNHMEFGIVVSIADALSFIFELKLNEEDQGERPLVDAGIGLCNKCGDILAQMYKLHRDFYETAATNSYLDLLFAKVFSQISKGGNQPVAKMDKDLCNEQQGDLFQYKTSEAKKTLTPHFKTSELCSPIIKDEMKDDSATTQTQMPQTHNMNMFQNSDVTNFIPVQISNENIPVSSTTSLNYPQPENPGDSQTNPNTAIQPNYVVICPLVIATSAGTNTIASVQLDIQNDDDETFFNSAGISPKRKYRRNRPKFTSICPECGKTFRSFLKNALQTHIMIVHRNESPHTCSICGRPCSTNKNMETHMSTHLGKAERDKIAVVKPISSKLYLCSECGTTLKSASSLRLHLSKHTNPKPCHCDKCDRRFGDKVSLRRHQVIHEEDGIFPFSCEACGQGFKVASLLKEHNMYCASKTAERPHQCSLCKKRFKLKQHLELHLFEMHKYTKEGARELVYPGLPKKKRK